MEIHREPAGSMTREGQESLLEPWGKVDRERHFYRWSGHMCNGLISYLFQIFSFCFINLGLWLDLDFL